MEVGSGTWEVDPFEATFWVTRTPLTAGKPTSDAKKNPPAFATKLDAEIVPELTLTTKVRGPERVGGLVPGPQPVQVTE